MSLTRFTSEDLARLKKIPGCKWNPERKQWLIPDTAEARAVLGEIVALPPPEQRKTIAVAPKKAEQPTRKPRAAYVAGRDKPLTTNPPHPLIKQVDEELVLRGMAYGTRKSYGQHLRNYTCPCGRCKGFNWLTRAQIEAEKATREQIRSYVVEMVQSGLVSGSLIRIAC